MTNLDIPNVYVLYIYTASKHVNERKNEIMKYRRMINFLLLYISIQTALLFKAGLDMCTQV